MREQNVLVIPIPRFNKPQVIFMFILMVVSFFAGSWWTKSQYMEKVKALGVTTANAANNPSGTAQAPQAVPTEDLSPKKVSIDDDPSLGNPNAPLTMIDFSDYECPFCKRYFDETFAQIKKNYIDTGKIKYVYRDLPLNFHQNAHKEAEAAECVRSLSDDATYFKYHEAIFTKTTSNGTGLALTALAPMAAELGLDQTAVQTCIDSGKFASEVDKDLADASSVGATGTPTFFIGKSSANGIIMGTKIVGAQPYSVFQAELDKQLK